MSGQRGRRSDYITCTCHIAEVSKTTHYCNEICDKLKNQHKLLKIFPSILFWFIQTNTISRLHSCIANKYSPRMHLFLVFFSNKLPIVVRDVCMTVRPSVRSSVSMSFRGNLISKEPIDPKIDLNVGYGVMHVQMA